MGLSALPHEKSKDSTQPHHHIYWSNSLVVGCLLLIKPSISTGLIRNVQTTYEIVVVWWLKLKVSFLGFLFYCFDTLIVHIEYFWCFLSYFYRQNTKNPSHDSLVFTMISFILEVGWPQKNESIRSVSMWYIFYRYGCFFYYFPVHGSASIYSLLRNFVASVAPHVQVWRSFLYQPTMSYVNINWHGWWATIVVLWTKGTETWTTYVYSGLRTNDVFIAIVAFSSDNIMWPMYVISCELRMVLFVMLQQVADNKKSINAQIKPDVIILCVIVLIRTYVDLIFTFMV
jgi:hypothetical protein